MKFSEIVSIGYAEDIRDYINNYSKNKMNKLHIKEHILDEDGCTQTTIFQSRYTKEIDTIKLQYECTGTDVEYLMYRCKFTREIDGEIDLDILVRYSTLDYIIEFISDEIEKKKGEY